MTFRSVIARTETYRFVYWAGGLPFAPIAGWDPVVTAERRGEGVGRGIAGACADLRERQLAGAHVVSNANQPAANQIHGA